MAIRDALLVSLVGISVVFFGLLLTSWLISAITLVPAWLNRRRQAPPAAAPAPAAPATAAPSTTPAIVPLPDADTAAVIAALLEVEMRLHGGGQAARFTFRRDDAGAPWRGMAAMRSGQPIKGAR